MLKSNLLQQQEIKYIFTKDNKDYYINNISQDVYYINLATNTVNRASWSDSNVIEYFN